MIFSSYPRKVAPSATIKPPQKIIKIVVISLLIDILAFTCILPLFPRTIQAYRAKENFESGTFLAKVFLFLQKIRYFQAHIINSARSYCGYTSAISLSSSESADIVLLGGLLGSIYSILQCIVSPIFGRLSDKFGRRKVLLFSMLGNILWSILWMFSDTFEKFLVARIVAGLCEANIQISTAIISDVSKPQVRAKQMALIGISFSIGFTIGPTIGAYFASMGSSFLSPDFMFTYFGISIKLAPFANAACFSLLLLLIETIYLYYELPETLAYFDTFDHISSNSSSNTLNETTDLVTPAKSISDLPKTSVSNTKSLINNNSLPKSQFKKQTTTTKVSFVYFAYMFIFSGMEYSLTFLTHDLFNYSNKQQGSFLGAIGLTSAIFQGYYLRKYVSRVGEKAMVIQGFAGCVVGMLSVAMMAYTKSTVWLYGVIVGFSLASAIVTSTMSAIITLLNSSGVMSHSTVSTSTFVSSSSNKLKTENIESNIFERSTCTQNKPPLKTSNIDSKAPIQLNTEHKITISSASRLGDFRSYGQLGRAFGPGTVCTLYWLFGPILCYSAGAVGVGIVLLAFSKIKLV
ncbi:hypothetical protein BB561_000970 [Smittium simulii]|uniref:Major facilitator superfamily (MFS) profile domain-containing protein n=1 Tax=Smittium simulii TaxID=133385 RepID=A0A2T9YWS1_9FUNG|nr:hypothetical protein BB561_000970 [Smittium simulii]